MVRKLIKYDFKSMLRIFIPLWLMMPVVSMLFSLSVRALVGVNSDEYSMPLLLSFLSPFLSSRLGMGLSSIVIVVMGILFGGLLIAIGVMTLVLVIQRFWKGLLSEEGYLMFTLPAEPWQLIVSKAAVAVTVNIVSSLVGVFSCILLAMMVSDEFILGWLEAWHRIGEGVKELGPEFWLWLFLGILWIIAGITASIYELYASMAMGQFFQGHRVAGACVSYVLINIVWSVLGSLTSMFISSVWRPDWEYYLNENFLTLFLLFMLLVSLIQTVIYHVITERILTTRLNLE